MMWRRLVTNAGFVKGSHSDWRNPRTLNRASPGGIWRQGRGVTVGIRERSALCQRLPLFLFSEFNIYRVCLVGGTNTKTRGVPGVLEKLEELLK